MEHTKIPQPQIVTEVAVVFALVSPAENEKSYQPKLIAFGASDGT